MTLEERTMRLQQGKYVTHFQMKFKIRKKKKKPSKNNDWLKNS